MSRLYMELAHLLRRWQMSRETRIGRLRRWLIDRSARAASDGGPWTIIRIHMTLQAKQTNRGYQLTV